MATTTVSTLPLRAAAARLGVDPDALRKRLRRGSYPGRKEGGTWVVDVPDGGQATGQDGQADGQAPSGPWAGHGPDGGQATPGASLATQRAADMAEYTRLLLAPYVARLEQQAERIGRLEEQLAAAQTQKNPDHGDRGSWWRRLFRG